MSVAYPAMRTRSKRSEILSKKTEQELVRLWVDERDAAARNRLILAYRPQAIRMARQYALRSGMPLDDLIQEAELGVMEAVDNFDPSRNTRVSTLALWHIRGRLQRHTLNYAGPCRVGTNFQDKRVFSRFRPLRAAWEARNQRPLDDKGRDEIAAQMGVKREVLNRMEPRIVGGDLSIDAPIRQADGESSGETIGSSLLVADESPESGIIGRHDRKKAVEVLFEHLGDLPERDQLIVKRRLLRDEPGVLAELGDELGISKERVRQIERGAINMLRKILEARGYTAQNLLVS